MSALIKRPLIDSYRGLRDRTGAGLAVASDAGDDARTNRDPPWMSQHVPLRARRMAAEGAPAGSPTFVHHEETRNKRELAHCDGSNVNRHHPHTRGRENCGPTCSRRRSNGGRLTWDQPVCRCGRTSLFTRRDDARAIARTRVRAIRRLLGLQEARGESQSGLCGTAGGGVPGRRTRVARHLYALRSRVFDD